MQAEQSSTLKRVSGQSAAASGEVMAQHTRGLEAGKRSGPGYGWANPLRDDGNSRTGVIRKVCL